METLSCGRYKPSSVYPSQGKFSTSSGIIKRYQKSKAATTSSTAVGEYSTLRTSVSGTVPREQSEVNFPMSQKTPISATNLRSCSITQANDVGETNIDTARGEIDVIANPTPSESLQDNFAATLKFKHANKTDVDSSDDECIENPYKEDPNQESARDYGEELKGRQQRYVTRHQGNEVYIETFEFEIGRDSQEV